jgi:release factor glutamine methyltransferase
MEMNEAELLFSDILGCSRQELYAQKGRPLGSAAGVIATVLKRRLSAEPLQYILGRTEFMGLEFKLTPDVFIPRPETELLVEKVVRLRSKVKGQGSRVDILEIGTGSGCIAVSLAKLLDNAKITATDISLEALKVAQENAKLHQVGSKITFLQSNVFTYDLRLTTYDLVVSNPPYIRSRDIDSLQPEIQYEPRIALDGGEDGLDFYRALAKYARQGLKKGGHLVIEIGFNQCPAVCSILVTSHWRVEEIVKDYNGIERIIVATSS